jgi:CubicO group peptidase (beta-lactamase class C family)
MKTLLLVLGVFIGAVLFYFVYTSKTKENFAKQNMVEQGLRPKDLIADDTKSRMNILERMQYYKVPGVSIAVVNGGKIEWTHGYGHITTDPKSSPIDKHTLFQAASISKPITAFGALILVQQGKISLDDDVNLYLKRWKVPENEFTKTEKVTLRRLLSHTAGTNVPGFPGYSVQDPIPSVEDVLEGKNVNTDPVDVVVTPGSEMEYSGGGTTVVQLLIEEIAGERFDLWMQKNVLMPLGMSESTFSQPLSPASALHAAYGHHLNGVKVEGNWHIYPEMGAAGLWTTPTDLAHFILYIQSALKGKETKPLDYDSVKEMISRQKVGDQESDLGLGIFLINQGMDLIFAHDGQNEGFIARLLGFAFRGQGVAIMMNNDADWNLMEIALQMLTNGLLLDQLKKKKLNKPAYSFERVAKFALLSSV